MKKIYRLKKNHEIASIVLKRQRIYSEHYVVYFLYNKERLNNLTINKDINKSEKLVTTTKIAISVSKKYGKAFERNKAKRIVREIVRPNLSLLNNKKIVIVVKQNAKGVPFVELKKELENTILKLNKKGEYYEQKNR